MVHVDLIAALLIVVMFWISSRYYLIPDGRLRNIRIVFFAYMGTYLFATLSTITHYELASWVRILWGYGSAVLFVVSVVFGTMLEMHLYRIKRYASLHGSSLEPIGIKLSEHLTILWINHECAQRLLHYDAQKLIGKPFEVIVHEDDHYKLNAIHKYAKNDERTIPISFELQLVTREYSRVWVLFVVKKDKENNQQILHGSIQNITESVYQHEYLILLRDTLDSAQIGVTITDLRAQTILYINPFDAEMHGYSVDELIGKDARMFCPEMFRWSEVDDEIPNQNYVSINVNSEGDVFPVQLNKSTFVYGEKSRIRRVQVTFCQKLSEISKYDVLSLGEQNLLLLAINASTMHVLWMNKRLCDMFEPCKDFPPLTSMFDQDNLRLIHEAIHQKKTQALRYSMTMADGFNRAVALAAFRGVSNTVFLVGRAI